MFITDANALLPYCHNVAELVTRDHHPGIQLLRAPLAIQPYLSERGQSEMEQSTGVEIRGVCEDDPLAAMEITVSSSSGQDIAVCFAGPFMTRQRIEIGSEPVTIQVHPTDRTIAVPSDYCSGSQFQPQVRRVLFQGGFANIHVHSLSGPGLRPPRAEELPQKTVLCYGTSITAGRAASAPHLCWVSQTGRRLGIDVLNKGFGGSCHCEPELVAWLSQQRFDAVVLELSVNMYGFGIEEFRKRVHATVAKLCCHRQTHTRHYSLAHPARSQPTT